MVMRVDCSRTITLIIIITATLLARAKWLLSVPEVVFYRVTGEAPGLEPSLITQFSRTRCLGLPDGASYLSWY